MFSVYLWQHGLVKSEMCVFEVCVFIWNIHLIGLRFYCLDCVMSEAVTICLHLVREIWSGGVLFGSL